MAKNCIKCSADLGEDTSRFQKYCSTCKDIVKKERRAARRAKKS